MYPQRMGVYMGAAMGHYVEWAIYESSNGGSNRPCIRREWAYTWEQQWATYGGGKGLYMRAARGMYAHMYVWPSAAPIYGPFHIMAHCCSFVWAKYS